MGSTVPGGYSTVIIKPSFPGNSLRSLERSGVTLASGTAGCWAAGAAERQSKARTNPRRFIIDLSAVSQHDSRMRSGVISGSMPGSDLSGAEECQEVGVNDIGVRGTH